MMPGFKKQCAIAFSILIFTWGSSAVWAAIQNNLSGIELNSTGSETQITFRSGAPISNQVVSQSADKIVIDLNNVDPNQSVQTDFASASNIEQVVLKPMGTDTLRMIIHGENLGTPVLSFRNENNAVLPSAHVVYENESQRGQSAGAQAHIVTPDASKTTAETTKSPLDDSNFKSQDLGLASPPITTEGTSTTTHAEKPEALSDRKPIVDNKTVDQETTADNNDSDWSQSLNGLMTRGLSLAGKVNPTLWFGIFGLGLFCFFVALFSKLGRRRSSVFAEPSDSSSLGLLSGLFNNTHRQNTRPKRNRQLFADESRPQRMAPSAPQPERQAPLKKDRATGGSRLSYLEPITSAPMLEEPIKPIVHKNHALSQYARNAAPPTPERRPGAFRQDALDQEIQRSLQIKQSLSESQNRKPLPKPGIPKGYATPTQKTTLPPKAAINRPGMPTRPSSTAPATKQGLPNNNVEVLDFLRSVADLMEKEGRPELANGVKRGMNPQLR